MLGTKTGYSLFRKVVRADRSMRSIVDEYVQPAAGQTILDLGCGTGDLALMLPDTVTYIGVDHNPAYIAADHMAPVPGGRHFINADLAELHTVDLPVVHTAVAIGVLHHLPDDAVVNVLTSVAQLIGRSGRVVTVDPVFWPSQAASARIMMAVDRGRFVRQAEHYSYLFRQAFPDAVMTVRHDLNAFPYSHCIFESGGDE